MKKKNKIVPYIRVGTKEQAETYYKHFEELDTPRLQAIMELIKEREKNKRL